MRKLRQALGKQQSKVALVKYTAKRQMTTNAVCGSGILHACAQGKSIWVSPLGICMGGTEGVPKAHFGHKGVAEWREKRPGTDS